MKPSVKTRINILNKVADDNSLKLKELLNNLKSSFPKNMSIEDLRSPDAKKHLTSLIGKKLPTNDLFNLEKLFENVYSKSSEFNNPEAKSLEFNNPEPNLNEILNRLSKTLLSDKMPEDISNFNLQKFQQLMTKSIDADQDEKSEVANEAGNIVKDVIKDLPSENSDIKNVLNGFVGILESFQDKNSSNSKSVKSLMDGLNKNFPGGLDFFKNIKF